VGSLFHWVGAFERGKDFKSRQYVSNTQWAASTIAYLLSREGASELVNKFYNIPSEKFDLSKLNCLNTDFCLSRHFEEPFVKLPPLFLPKASSHSDSHIIGAEKKLQEKQGQLVEISRIFTYHWYKSYEE
jgi:hypothetical protein